MSPTHFKKFRSATSPLALSLALGLAFGTLVSPVMMRAAHAEDATAPKRFMTITGTGDVSARPDIAYLDSGVVSEGKTAADALAENTKAMNAIFTGLEAMKIAKEDIRTSQFSVNPLYTQPPQRPDGTQDAPAIRGYQVTNQVSVTVRKLDTLGAVLDKLVTLGSNRVDSVRFEIEKPEPLLDKAREAAVTDAMRKAKLYAKAAGVTLGAVTNISESGNYQQPMYMKASAMAMRDSAPVPMAAGTQQLSASVSVTVAIE
ncbi:MAG: SIMPL domain-containing protein [Parvibaculaceae bacterium]